MFQGAVAENDAISAQFKILLMLSIKKIRVDGRTHFVWRTCSSMDISMW